MLRKVILLNIIFWCTLWLIIELWSQDCLTENWTLIQMIEEFSENPGCFELVGKTKVDEELHAWDNQTSV